MVNLAYLLIKCAKSNIKIGYEDSTMLEEDQEEQYFEASNLLRLALSMNPNLSEANFLLGVLHEQGLGID
jgi:TPR repeat protein